MILDKDLVREILLAVEKSNHLPIGWMDLDVPGRSKLEVSYHVRLLDEAGFIEAQDLSIASEDGFDWRPKRLTFRGHDFLETVRDNKIWGLTKDAAHRGGTATIGFLWELGKVIAKQEIMQRTGYSLA